MCVERADSVLAAWWRSGRNSFKAADPGLTATRMGLLSGGLALKIQECRFRMIAPGRSRNFYMDVT